MSCGMTYFVFVTERDGKTAKRYLRVVQVTAARVELPCVVERDDGVYCSEWQMVTASACAVRSQVVVHL